MWRLTEIDYADGGKSTATYNDSASPINVVKTELITSALTRTTQTNLDNYGRPNNEQADFRPGGYDLQLRRLRRRWPDLASIESVSR